MACILLLSVFSISGASAQRDKNWLDAALERTVALASPWQPSSQVPSATEDEKRKPTTRQELAPGSRLVLELPGEEKTPPSREGASTAPPTLDVESVDVLPYPWDAPDTQPHLADDPSTSKVPEAREGLGAHPTTNHPPTELSPAEVPSITPGSLSEGAGLASRQDETVRELQDPYGQSFLIDPWLD